MLKPLLIPVLAVLAMLLVPAEISDAAIRRDYREGGTRQRFLRRDRTDRFNRVMSRRPPHPWSPPISRRERMRLFERRNPRRHTYIQPNRRIYQPPQQVIVEPPSRRDYAAPTVEPPGAESQQEEPRRPLILRPLPGQLQPEELIPEPTPEPNESKSNE